MCALAVWLGIIPPVRVTLNRGGAGAAECANSFNSRLCYRHAVIVSIMDDERLLTALFLRLGQHARAADSQATSLVFRPVMAHGARRQLIHSQQSAQNIHHCSLLLHLLFLFVFVRSAALNL